MTFEVKLSNQAAKFLKKQDTHIKDRLKAALQNLREPFAHIEHFEREGYYKFRIGEYRALVDIDTNGRIVWVRVLDKRERIYDRI